jgi:hypothetical protein
MDLRSTTRIAVIALLVAVVGGLSASAKGQSAGNAVTEWNLIAVNTLAGLPQPAGGAAPTSAINVAMVQGAVYDAVNATEPKHHRPYLLKRRFSARASKEAAVATAAYRVLTDIVATVPATIPFPTRASVLQSLETAYANSLAAIPEGPFKRQGIAAGNAAAEAMIAAREDDGRFGPSQWVPNPAPGHWQPLPNPDGTPMLDPTPWVGGVTPFLIESPSQFRTAGPLALGSAAYAAEVNEVKALGAVNSAARTQGQTYIARWWQSNPIVTWNEVARALVGRFDVDLADSARLLAMQNLSSADAAINCWNDKYHWDFWRPWQAIRRAAEDGNPATEPDPTWTALITAPYPDHPSGHLCNDGAHVRVLRMFFADDVGFEVTSRAANPGGPATRHFDSFAGTLAEIVEARIWAGLHYRTADVQAEQLGRNVAEYMAENYFQPVGKAATSS